jgi:hypothetical protein
MAPFFDAYYSSLVPLLFSCVLSSGAGAAEAAAAAAYKYNVAGFGARPDGRTDSAGAFASAWPAACRSQEPATVYVPSGRFLLSRAAFTGPCSSRVMTLRVDDTLVAPSGYTSRGGSSSQQGRRRLDRVRPRRRPHCVGRHRRRPRRGAVACGRASRLLSTAAAPAEQQ